MKKYFTLVELIISVIVLSLLASIVLVKVLDMKNKSIGAAVANNTKIIQTAVDRYALDHNGEYPIKNELLVNLSDPQLIDIAALKEEGYLKKELDTSKVKKQYYWLDVFGIAWGSTEKTVEDLTSITSKVGSTRMEFIIPEGATSYRIYEVLGYNKAGKSTDKKKRHYKLISEVSVKKERQKVNFEIPDSSRIYLFSTVDKYEQESAPVGVFYKGPSGFKPIISGEGKYLFEIDSYDEMFWVDFKKVMDTPGDSSISFRFRVKDTNGSYMNWTDNFFSLPSSKAITVEVDLKGDADGNKPSLYDLRVLYRYKNEEVLVNPPTTLTNPKTPSDICPVGYKTSNILDGKWIDGKPKLLTYLVNLEDEALIDSIKHPNFFGYYIVSVTYEYYDGSNYVSANGTFDIPAGACVNVIYELEATKKIGGDGNPKPIEDGPPGFGGQAGGSSTPEQSSQPTPEIKLCKTNCPSLCSDCSPPCLIDCVEDSCNSADCKETDICKENECISPPVCIEGDMNCIPPVCIDNCTDGPPTAPNPKDAEINNPDWITINTLRFYANGPDGKPTRWVGVDKIDKVEDGKTRILYRYSTSNGNYWSEQVDYFPKNTQSSSLMVVAYLQVHENVKGDKNQVPPEVTSIKILHEMGAINLNMLRPSLVIIPSKSNNKGRDVFSDETEVDWQYKANDPKNRAIKTIEWKGDIRTKYPVGTYTVEARVSNDTDLWSEWEKYTFDVLSEKPVAKITKNVDYVSLNKEILWSAAKSFDPDKDRIVKIEWRGDKQNVYNTVGKYTVGLRVQDEEGHWSDWAEESFTLTKEEVIIYRHEAEDTSKYTNAKSVSRVAGANASNGSLLYFSSGGGFDFKFTGTGFDLVTPALGKSVTINVDGANYKGTTLFKIRGLELGEHTIKITSAVSTSNNVLSMDYFDIYSTDDDFEISSYKSNVVQGNVEHPFEGSGFSPRLNQSIRYYYELKNDAFLTINVLDSKNNIVRNLMAPEKISGGSIFRHSINWDGKDNVGQLLGNGEYNIQILGEGVSKESKKEHRYPVYLSNAEPSYRIEGESTDTSKIIKVGARTTSDKTASGGKLTVISTNKSSITFFFDGTGFDLKLLKSDGKNFSGTLDVDGATYPLSSGQLELKSLRNLPKGPHIVKLTVVESNNTHNLGVDYIDVYE